MECFKKPKSISSDFIFLAFVKAKNRWATRYCLLIDSVAYFYTIIALRNLVFTPQMDHRDEMYLKVIGVQFQ